MSLTNFSLPFGILAPPTHTAWGVTTSPLHSVHQLATNTNNLLYSPAAHQQQSDDEVPPPPGAEFYKNNPYAPPQVHQQHQLQQQQQFQYNNNRRKVGNTYLPPPAQTGAYNHHHLQQQQPQQPEPPQQISFINTQHHFSNNNNNNNQLIYNTQAAAAGGANTVTTTSSRTYGEGSYSRIPGEQQAQQQQQQQTQQQQTQQQQTQQQQFFNSFSATKTTTSFNTHQTASHQQKSPLPPAAATPPQQPPQPSSNQSNLNKVESPAPVYGATAAAAGAADAAVAPDAPVNKNAPLPERPPGFTRVQAGHGSRTQVHAVLDYDVEEGEEEEEEGADYYNEHDPRLPPNKHGSKKSSSMPVTPIQGPIFLKNGTVPVVPLFSYPTINNGSFVQIPIWWTALSVALGLDVRGDIIKGVPCIKRYHQLFCPTAGNSYPIDKIERFIDDNKALMRRMYGDFEMNMDVDGTGTGPQNQQRRRRFIDEPDIFIPPGVFPSAVVSPDDDNHRVEEGESYFGKLRDKRQAGASRRGGGSGKASSFGRPATAGGPGSSPGNAGASTGRLDACESKVEIVTPYWASNSAGKIRAIVNTQHFEQAIHQEICSKTLTPRCKGDCGCEQKYKWHRLLAYDPDNDCKGIFMDWFLFPSCCVCRCNP